MFKSMTNWLESVGMVERPSTPPGDKSEDSKQDREDEKSDDVLPQENDIDRKEQVVDVGKTDVVNEEKNEENKENEEDPIDAAMKKLDDVGEKAVHAAKEWGSYLYSFGKVAGETVYGKAKDTASLLKHTVQDKTLIGHFEKEQDKFVTGQRERKNKAEAAVPPWVGYNEEEQMKSQILALSLDRRNFLRNPPSGVQFQFDVSIMYPVAMSTLQEDPNLQKMRFDLVPQQIKEEQFWRNYFYRVSLIKQSTQLSSLTTEAGGERSSGSSRRSSTDSLQKERSSPNPIPKNDQKTDMELLPDSPTEHEFASDAFTDAQINEDDLRNEMKQLGVEEGDKKLKDKEDSDDVPEWEKELQKELQDYEMIGGTGQEFDDDEIESEILAQIEDETNAV